MEAMRTAHVNKTVLSQFLDCSVPYVDVLIKESGFPTFKRGGTYPLRDTVVWFVRHLQARESVAAQETARKVKVEREIKELTLETLRKNVVRVEDVYAELAKPFGAARGRLLGLARQVAPQVVGMKSTLEAEQIIDQYINDILNEWSTGIHIRGVDAPVVSDPQTAAKVDRKSMGRRASVSKRGGKRRGRKVAHRTR